MTILLIIIGVILLLATSLMLLKLTVCISLDKENNEKLKTDFRIKIANREIDLSRFAGKKKTPKDSAGPEKAETEDESEKSLIEKLSKLRTNIARGKYTYLLSKRYVRKKISVQNLDFSLMFGLGDAAQTGIATGAVWGGIYNIFGFVDSLFTVRSHNFNVTPVFEAEGIAYRFNTKIECRVLNLLLVAFAVMINYIKTGKKL